MHDDDRSCPQCNARGRPVPATTVERFVAPHRLAKLGDASGFLFCGTPGCETVYFRGAGRGESMSIDKRDIVVRVGIKESHEPRPICYCFGFTAADIVSDAASGAPSIADRIRGQCKQGLDRCELTNPRGVCCLGDVQAVLRTCSGSNTPPTGECCGD